MIKSTWHALPSMVCTKMYFNYNNDLQQDAGGEHCENDTGQRSGVFKNLSDRENAAWNLRHATRLCKGPKMKPPAHSWRLFCRIWYTKKKVDMPISNKT